MADDRYHEFHLEGKQLAFLFMTATAVVVVSFLVGVMVGRGVERVGADGPESAVVDRSDDLVLTSESREIDGGADDLAEGLAASSGRRDDYSYYERLNRPTPAAEKLRAPEPVREPEPVPPPPAVAAGPASPAVVERPASAQAQPAPNPRPAPAAAAPAPAVARVSLPSAAADPSGTGFSVQVLSVASREQADASARSLASKGYPAYVQPIAGGLFRVRVGRFADRNEAVAVARRLETEEKFGKPWVDR